MYRRFLLALFRRTFFVFLLICLGCSAQSVSPDVSRKIERQVRSYYNLPPRVNVVLGPLKSSEFPNYDTISITLQGGEKRTTFDFLLSKDRNTLIRMTKLDLTKDPFAEVMSKMDLSNRPIRGTKGAKVVVVNYDDFQCPFCSRMHQTLFPELLKEYGDRIEFVYKDFPLTEIHPWAMHAAVDANCLAAQSSEAYWDFADYVHDNQREFNNPKGLDARFAALDRVTLDQAQKHSLDPAKLQSCVKAQDETAIKTSMKEAEGLGVDGTPALFVNGQKVDGGALPIEELRAVFDRALQDEGLTPPTHPAEQSSGSGGK
jgi:protein-disulfide isomerase